MTALPSTLDDLSSPPSALHGLGDFTLLTLDKDQIVAIVGTRNASPYGMRTAHALGNAFAAAGIAVVSGMARGIDSAAHRGALDAHHGAPDASGGALDARGKTIAILGTGPDIPYPTSNRALHAEIVEHGLVLSESKPGTRAFPGCFPRRNRIIAALAKVTIVVEAPYKSGAINTATQALEMGRTVAVVPGQIDSSRSSGSNLLLRDGAQIITTIDDALGLYGLARSSSTAQHRRETLGELEAAIWDVLGDGPAQPELIGAKTGLPIREILSGLGRLELNGLVGSAPGGEIARLGI